MNPRFVGILIFVIALASFVTGYLVYPYLPVMAVSHWNAAGEANGTLPRLWAAYLLPGLMIFILGLWALLPHLDPTAPGFKNFRYVYDFIMFLIVAFLAYVYALMLGINLGWQVDLREMLLPVLGVFIIVLGALLPHVKRNWFVGIRTPWTLSSETVWTKTHKLAAKYFETAGVLIVFAVFTSPVISAWLVVGPIVVAALVSIVYSYIYYRQEQMA